MIWIWEESPVGGRKTLEWTQAFRSQRNWFPWQVEKRINKLRTVCAQTIRALHPLGPQGQDTKCGHHSFTCSLIQYLLNTNYVPVTALASTAGRTLPGWSVRTPRVSTPWVMAVTLTPQHLSEEARERQVGWGGTGAAVCREQEAVCKLICMCVGDKG